MAFSTQNSARRIVQEKPRWKSRPLDLGNRHRTTLNFADLVPAYWTEVQPGDKIKADATILAKFMPLIAPAFSRMKIKSEWFYVPLKQISPNSLRALQDFKPDDATAAFTKLLQTGRFSYTPSKSENQQIYIFNGFPSIPAWWLSFWFQTDTCSVFSSSDFRSAFSASSEVYNGSSALGLVNWRTPDGVTADITNVGLEDFVCYSSMNRVRKFLNYLGLPKRLTAMRYNTDVLSCCNQDSGVQSTYQNLRFEDGSTVPVDFYLGGTSPFMDGVTHALNFTADNVSINSALNISVDASSYGLITTYFSDGLAGATDSSVTLKSSWSVYSGCNLPSLPTASGALVTLLPSMAYQKIYNDFYRDEKLQKDEVRLYPDAVYSPADGGIVQGSNPNLDIYCAAPTSLRHDFQSTSNPGSPFAIDRFLQNLCMLRRRNRAKDVLSSCVTDKVLVNRLANTSTAPNVFQSNLFSKIERYLMKKEFTGSTWAEWLSNFFGENSNDYLNNNVIFLGAKESTVSISENIQTSESSSSAAQGNRAGLAADFHNGDSIYFRVPDFGIIMCVVSVIPDELDNFNGLQERFERYSPYQFNLPDLQNIGFAPVFNRRANISHFDKSNLVGTTNVAPYMYDGAGVFGYQPFGYSHTYVPDVISGDFQNSLRYWHQSPDLDTDFVDFNLPTLADIAAGWSRGQLHLNANLPAIGLRQIPLGADLSGQYYNNIFAVVNDESGDHIVADMRFFVNCHRNTAFFTDAVGCDE